jgi:hypothetical protein
VGLQASIRVHLTIASWHRIVKAAPVLDEPERAEARIHQERTSEIRALPSGDMTRR